MNADDIKPIAFVTGYMRGYPTIKTLDKSLVLPVRMALYSYEDVLNAVQAEREACAKLAEDFVETRKGWHTGDLMAAIRARGEVK